jgi:catechol 2,3-dioxygenase-like lactoylglutathione lyase family enzyme
MITKFSHISIFALSQEAAYEFYVNKLGFKVHTDVKMENGFRWLTLTAPEQPDLIAGLLTKNLKQKALYLKVNQKNSFMAPKLLLLTVAVIGSV